MARLFNDAANDEAENTAAVVTAPPFTLACHCRTNDVDVTGAMMGLSRTSAANHYFGISIAGAAAGDFARAFVRSGAGEVNAISSTGVTINTDHHVCGVYAASNSRFIYLDGGSKVESTTNVVPASIDQTSLGYVERNASPVYYFSGSVWEAAIWNAALTDREVAALANAYSPLLIRPQSLVAYWPLFGRTSPEIDLLGGFPMTLTGTVISNHGRMIYPANEGLYLPVPPGPIGEDATINPTICPTVNNVIVDVIE